MSLKTFALVSMITTILAAGAVGCAAEGATSDRESETGTQGQTASEIRAASHVSMTAFRKAMDDEAQGMENADGCTFSVKSTAAGVVVELTDKDGTITLNVGDSAAITHKVKPDGDSSVESYDIAGVGSVEMVHADDAFEEVSVTNAKKKTATCEVDF